MVQQSVEALLQQKLGLDINSVGSRLIERAVQQQQRACGIRDRATYLRRLQSSSQAFNQLVEAVVVPETWFFRNKAPFAYLRQLIQQLSPLQKHRSLRLLSVPCSTGEEPYSIAMTLLEAGLSTAQFHIDAVDISQQALSKAKQGLYGKKSFRGGSFNLDSYFQHTAEGYQVKPVVRKSVHWIHGNIMEPHFLVGKQYDLIFCRNLLIYLDQSARQQVIEALDHGLKPQGFLFLGAVETPQITHPGFISIPAAFAFQKQTPSDSSTDSAPWPPLRQSRPTARQTQKPLPSPLPADAVVSSQHSTRPVLEPKRESGGESAPSVLERAKQLADRGDLSSAAQLCQSYLRVHPAQASAYLLLGEIYQALNQLQTAEQCLQKAIYLEPNHYEALIHLALLKQQQGDHVEAERLRSRARRRMHSDDQSVQVRS